MTISESNFRLINGGVLQLSVVKMSDNYVDHRNSSTKQNIKVNEYKWYEHVGEILFFKKPSDILGVKIETSKEVYTPGDLVEYTVSVVNKSTG